MSNFYIQQDSNSESLYDILADFALQDIFVGPTGVTGATGASITGPTGAAGGGGGDTTSLTCNLLGTQVGMGNSVYVFGEGTGAPGTTPDRCLFIVPADGTLDNLYLKTQTAITAGATIVAGIRVNGVNNGTLTITRTNADGTAVQSNTVNTISVSAGDYIQFYLSETGGTTNSGVIYLSGSVHLTYT